MAPRRAYQRAAELIEQLINQGRYPPGARLPGERDLAEKLGVSRVTIREAEIALQATGRIDIKSGSGAFVREYRPEGAPGILQASALELIEARLIVESEAAALAAHNITEEQLVDLSAIVEDICSSRLELSCPEQIRQFHMTIANATANAAIAYSVSSIWKMHEASAETAAVYNVIDAQNTKSRCTEYRAIIQAMTQHDPTAARLAMRAHLNGQLEAVLEISEDLEKQRVLQEASRSRERFLSAAKNL